MGNVSFKETDANHHKIWLWFQGALNLSMNDYGFLFYDFHRLFMGKVLRARTLIGTVTVWTCFKSDQKRLLDFRYRFNECINRIIHIESIL